MALKDDTSFKPCDGLAWRCIDEEIFLYQPSGALHIFEGAVAQHVWKELDNGSATLATLRKTIIENFDVSLEEADSDLRAFLSQLIELEIVST